MRVAGAAHVCSRRGYGPAVATEAVTLFFARAAMAGVTLEAGPAELALASSICRKAGGLPLAIELVANRLRVASLTELAGRLGPSDWPARSTRFWAP